MSKYSQQTWNRLRKKARQLGYHILMSDGTSRLLDKWARDKGVDNYQEYLDTIAIERGFTSYKEYMKVWQLYPGMPDPIKENRKDSRFLGSYIAENGVFKLFEGCQKMKTNNPGYDIICTRGYKVDVKASSLDRFNTFKFSIWKNQIADYFALVGFDNVFNLKPLYLWIIKGNEMIQNRRTRLNDMYSISIANEPELVKPFEKYNRVDKLKELGNLCGEFNKYNKIEIDNGNTPTKAHILDIIVKMKLSGKSSTPSDIFDVLREEQKIENRLPLIPECDCRSSKS